MCSTAGASRLVGVDERGVSDLGSSKWAAIGIVTLPATVPDTDPTFRGTILPNPGGPGELGTQYALDVGKVLQGIFDRERHYEILGFDPRGIGTSTPSASCYGDEKNRDADRSRQTSLLPVESGDVVFNYRYQQGAAFSLLCAEKNGPDNIFYHMSTAAVARDMLEIVNRMDELRGTEQNASAFRDSDHNNRSLPRLQYYGGSYGTVIGNHFLSMFPDRVERIVLDSVANYAEESIPGKSVSRSLKTGILRGSI